MSWTLKDEIKTKDGEVHRRWKDQYGNNRYSKSGTGGSNKGYWMNAHKKIQEDRNIKVPNPQNQGQSYIQVSKADASKMGQAAMYDSPNVNFSADEIIVLPSIDEEYTASEIAQAYRNGDVENDSVVKYIGGK